MSDALLASQTDQSTDAVTTQGGGVDVDTAPAPEQQKQSAEGEKTPVESEATGETKNAPELYEFEVPQGLPEATEKDEAVFDALAKVARDLDLSQDQAQQLVNEVWPVMHQRSAEQLRVLHDQWVADTKADKEIGGQKLDENLAVARRALTAFGNEGLQGLLNGPLGSHPEVVRFLVKVGRTVSEDTFVGGARRGETIDLNDDAAVAKRLYPKSP